MEIQLGFRERFHANRWQYIFTLGIFIVIGHLIVIMPRAPMILNSAVFGLLLWSAGKCKRSLVAKYILSGASLIVLVAGLLIYDVPLGYISHFAFYVTLMYAFALPDFYSPNIVGLVFVSIFLSYWKTQPPNETLIRIIGVICSSLSYSCILQLMRRLTVERDKYQRASITDSLTSLSSLEHIIQVGQAIIDNSLQLSVMVLDVDFFKQINDTYGHLAGNRVLVQISKLLVRTMSGYDTVIGRMGGDEFVIVLKDYSLEQSQKLRCELNKSIEQEYFKADNDLIPIRIACSIGLSYCPPNSAMKFDDLLHIADLDMFYNKYKSKNEIKYIDSDNTPIPDEYNLLLDTMAEKDMYTVVHSQHAALYAQSLGKALHLSSETTAQLYIAGLFHDIGKLTIPNRILRKPLELTKAEQDAISQHIANGISILENLHLSPIVTNAIKYHHERWDGRGYPFALTGRATPIEARIIQLADAYSAMTIRRVYCKKLTVDEVISEIKQCSGSQFDPDIAAVFIDLLSEKPIAL